MADVAALLVHCCNARIGAADAKAAFAKGPDVVNGAEPGTLDDADTQQSIETLQRLAR